MAACMEKTICMPSLHLIIFILFSLLFILVEGPFYLSPNQFLFLSPLVEEMAPMMKVLDRIRLKQLLKIMLTAIIQVVKWLLSREVKSKR